VFGEQPRAEDLEIINQAERIAKRLNMPLRIYPLLTESQTLVCDADPINAVYVNHRGDVTPCVYLGLTVQGQVPRYFYGEAHPFETYSFGSVCDGFDRALHGEERKAFSTAFQDRSAGSNPLVMFSLLSIQGGEIELSPPPIPCRHCYKMLGI